MLYPLSYRRIPPTRSGTYHSAWSPVQNGRERLLTEVHSEKGLVAYGFDDVINALLAGAVEIILVADNMRKVKLEVATMPAVRFGPTRSA